MSQTRTAAIVTAAQAAHALGMTVEESIDHACRKVAASPAALVLARRIASATLMRSESSRA